MGWQRYAQLEPFGEDRGDLRMGILASVLANVNRDPSRKPDPFKAEDFMPDFDGSRAPKPMTSEETWAETKKKATAYAKGGAFKQPRQQP